MRALLFGYYGFNNAGDELILKSIISELKKKDPEIQLSVLSSNTALTQNYTNIKSYNRWNAFSVIRALMRTKAVIFGGGGLIQDSTGSPGLYYYLGVLVAAKLMGKALFAYSISANKIKNVNSYFTRLVLNLFNRIAVRDIFTLEYFKSIGVKKDKLILSSDPVLCTDINVTERNSSFKKLIFVPRDYCVNSKNLTIKIAEVLKEVSGKTGYSLEIVPFQECDSGFSKKLLEALGGNAKIHKWNSPIELYEYFKTGDFVLSMRLHGLILASMYAIPCAGMSDDSKLSRYLNEIGQQEMFSLSSFDMKTCVDTVISVINNFQNYRDNIIKAYPQLQKRAKRALDAFFDSAKVS